ncbi:GIY-YIG nuclease family protein [Winogradskyella sp.]|uniref:GIY-YIG nuclease family protein n=1 Tax=Winogradskyella sp. TaxID=1883156 RepID=UPI00351240A3
MKTIGSHNYYVYILTNKNKTVLYTGVTNNLRERLYAHKHPEPFSKAFTAKYKCHYLIYYEHFFDINEAIHMEKVIKGKSRHKKELLITEFNPSWKFLNDDVW